jgi:phage-related protein (TIGR01555 family)
MALPPLQLAAPKPRMTLDEFRTARATHTTDAARELREVMDAFQNASARLGFGTSNLMEGSAYPFNRITLNYVLLTSLYRGSWIIRKIVDALVDDMTKNWLTPTSELTPAKLTRFRKEGIQGTGTIPAFKRGMKMGRLYGGAGAVIVVKGRDDFEKPLKVEDVELDSYRGLLVFDRWSGIAPGTEISDDLDEPLNFGLPKYYQITTEGARVLKVHHTRILRFCGPDLPNWEWQANMRWGASIVEAMFDELKKRDNTSWNIASLIFRANILELNSPQLEQMLSGLGANAVTAQRFYSAISAMNQLMSNQGLMVTGEKQTVGQHSYSFGGVAEVYTQFMLDICGATEYPMSRLFGRSSSGLSGTNEGDEHSYYELVKQRQTSEADPLLRQLLPVIAMSVWGQVPKDFDWIWNPVNTPPDKERVELAAASTTSVVEVYNTGAISQKTLLMELKEQSSVTGLWTNITDDDIEAADDETQSMGEQAEAQQNMALEQEASKAALAAPTADAAAVDCEEAKKLSHKEVKYEEPAKGKDHCSGCIHYYASTPDPKEDENQSCQIVQSPVMPDGWCSEFRRGVKDAATPDVFPATPILESDSWDFQGLPLAIENLRGSTRHGANHHTRLTAPYGYIKGTSGADNDPVDVFVGDVATAPYAFVIHTKNPKTGKYDEDKVVLGVESARQAKALFDENYDRPGFFESMEKMTVPQLKEKLLTLRGRKLTA